MQIGGFLDSHPVFTTEELAAFLRAKRKTNPHTMKALLAYHHKQGHVLRVRRGLYVVVPRGTSPDSFAPDPYLVASRLDDDSVLSHHTALELHGRAYSVWEEFIYSTRHRRGLRLTFQGRRYRAVPHPPGVLRAEREDFGVQTVDRGGTDARLTTLERSLVDVLHRPDLGGGWEETWRSLESVEFFDLDAVVEYAGLLDNATTAAKVGFYLEQHREPLIVTEAHLERLQALAPKRPHYMERSKRETGRFVARWNLVVPAAVFERSWEEPS